MKNQIGIYEATEYDLNSAGWGRMTLVHGQNAGAMYLEVETLTVFECYFFNNSNLKGGAVYLNKNKKYLKFKYNQVYQSSLKKSDLSN